MRLLLYGRPPTRVHHSLHARHLAETAHEDYGTVVRYLVLYLLEKEDVG